VRDFGRNDKSEWVNERCEGRGVREKEEVRRENSKGDPQAGLGADMEATKDVAVLMRKTGGK